MKVAKVLFENKRGFDIKMSGENVEAKPVVPLSVTNSCKTILKWMDENDFVKNNQVVNDFLTRLSGCPNVLPEHNPNVVVHIFIDYRGCHYDQEWCVPLSFYLVRLFFKHKEISLGEISGKHSEVSANIVDDCSVRFSKGDVDDTLGCDEAFYEIYPFSYDGMEIQLEERISHILQTLCEPVTDRDMNVEDYIKSQNLETKVENAFDEVRKQYPKCVFLYFNVPDSSRRIGPSTKEVCLHFDDPIKAAYFCLEPREVEYCDDFWQKRKIVFTRDMITRLEETDDYEITGSIKKLIVSHDFSESYSENLFDDEELKGRQSFEHYLQKFQQSQKRQKKE